MMSSHDSVAASPLEEWQFTFKRDVLTMRQIMLLRTREGDEGSRQKMYPWIKAISDAVTELDDSVKNLKRYVAEERARLASLHRLQNAISTQTERYSLIKAQIPEEVREVLGLHANEERGEEYLRKENRPVERKAKQTNKPKESFGLGTGSKINTPISKEKIVSKQTRGGLPKATTPRTSKTKKSLKKGGSNDSIVPFIKPVSQEQLNAAPQYVKGRLTVAKIQGVVDSLNKIADAKYSLLAKAYRDLNSVDKNIYQDFQESECDETAGKQFLTDAEIKGFGKLRLDATAKSVINVLRHVGALKHVRGKNNVTILIIN